MAGRLSRVTDALGHVREIETNAAGLPTAVKSPVGAVTKYRRDLFGRITEVVDPAGGTSAFAWTVEGNLLSRRHPDGSVESWRYDGEGNEVEHTDVLGQISRTTRTHFDMPSVQTLPDGSRFEYSYDHNLRVVAITDGGNRNWTFDWDPAGRLSREVDVHGREIRYGYDPSGRLIERVNAAGEVTRYSYDVAGNRTLVEAADTRAEYTYDVMGRIARARNGDADIQFERDELGRVLREVVNGQAVESSYDPLGRRLRRRTPTGAVSTWEYDGSGNAVSLRSGGHDTAFRFDDAGREVERLLDTGTMLAQVWDAGHRLAEQTVSVVDRGRTGVNQVQHRDFRYRADGRLTEASDRLGGSQRYELDPAGRVLAAVGADRQERYTYDQTGTLVGAASPVRVRRDPQGRVIMRQRKRLSAKPDTWHYSWNSEDRLTGVVTPDGVKWRYRYDALGRRVAKERLGADGSVLEFVRFHWDGVQLAEQVGSDGLATTWDFAPGTVRPLTQVERMRSAENSQEWVDGEFYAIVTDLIGTPTELVDTQGQIAWRRQETVWGEALGRLTDRATTPLRFPGQYHDPESGLRYNFQRYYDPATGQYISADPLGSAAGPDPCAYAPNPTSGFDALGMALCERGATTAIDDYRSRYQVGKDKNVAIADYEIDGQSGQQIGVSGKHQYPGSAPMPAEYTLDRGSDDIARRADSEMKILEDMKSNLSPDASGKVRIYSERPVCDSCQAVVDDFQRSFPNIEVTFSDLGRGRGS